jgi:hypothetical protein
MLLQQDSSTCRFWVIIITLAIRLKLDTHAVYQLCVSDIKSLILLLYSSFVSNPNGFAKEHLINVFHDHGLTVLLPEDAPDIVCVIIAVNHYSLALKRYRLPG